MEREPSLFPSVYGTTRLFPRSTFLEALELVVKQAGLTVPNRGEPLAPNPQHPLRTAGCRLAPCFVPPPGCHTLNKALHALGTASLAMALCQHLEEVTYGLRRAQGWRRWACRIA